MAKTPPRRLKSADYKATLTCLWGRLPGNCKELVVKLVGHINWLEEERLTLERDIREYHQQIQFERGVAERTQIAMNMNTPAPTYIPRGQRIYEMIRSGEGERYAERFSTPLSELVKAANEWALAHGKEPLS